MLKTIKQDELIPMLNKAGIKAKEYANPAAVGNPAEFFLSTIAGGKGILIKKGEGVKLKIATDAARKQAVLSVMEGKRKISRKMKFKVTNYTKGTSPSGNMLDQKARSKFNIVIPDAEITVNGMKEVKRVHINKEYEDIHYEAVVSANVTKSRTNTFLMGMDETSHFISVLPESVDTVAQAHALLRPKSVKVGTKRQGEFFFVAATSRETTKAIKEGHSIVVANSVQLESGSNHHAQFAIVRKIRNGSRINNFRPEYGTPLYVKGLIFDKRAYRHAPVDLGDTWHKVIRNKEKNVDLQPQGGRKTRARYD